MAKTANITIGPDWTEVVDDETAYYWLSLPFTTVSTFEVAVWDTTDDAANIDIAGHPLRAEHIDSVSRAVTGDGFIYARCRSGATTVVVTQ